MIFPWPRSRKPLIGFSEDESKEYLISYSKRLCRGFSVPTSVNFAQLDPDVFGESKCLFSDAGSVVAYDIRLDPGIMAGLKPSMALDAAFVKMLVAAGHESAHLYEMESKDTKQALIRIADYGNMMNYRDNYKFNRREIQAEISGLEQAQSEIRDKLKCPNADQLLLDYVNDAVTRCYFIGAHESGAYTEMDDVFKALNEAYDAAGLNVRLYTSKMQLSDDAIAKLALTDDPTKRRGLTAFDREWDFVYDALKSAPDDDTSVRVLASAALYAYPSTIREAAGAKLPDLSIKTVFGRDPPYDKIIEPHDPPNDTARSQSAVMRKLELARQQIDERADDKNLITGKEIT